MFAYAHPKLRGYDALLAPVEQPDLAWLEQQAGRLAPEEPAFIVYASGVKNRHVIEREGILDPTRMAPRIAARPDDALSLSSSPPQAVTPKVIRHATPSVASKTGNVRATIQFEPQLAMEATLMAVPRILSG